MKCPPTRPFEGVGAPPPHAPGSPAGGLAALGQGEGETRATGGGAAHQIMTQAERVKGAPTPRAAEYLSKRQKRGRLSVPLWESREMKFVNGGECFRADNFVRLPVIRIYIFHNITGLTVKQTANSVYGFP